MDTQKQNERNIQRAQKAESRAFNWKPASESPENLGWILYQDESEDFYTTYLSFYSWEEWQDIHRLHEQATITRWCYIVLPED